MKPLILGEGPSKSGDRYYQFPLSGAVGKRLCTWAGIEPLDRDRSMTSDYARYYWALTDEFDVDNFFTRWPQDWTPAVAMKRLREAEIQEQLYNRPVVLLGVRVQTVFRLADVCRSGGFFNWEDHHGFRSSFVTAPHPSGLNRLYNAVEMQEQTGRVLREAMKRAKKNSRS